MLIRTLRSDNGDVHENVAKKQNSHHFKLFRDYPNSLCYLKEGHRTKDKGQSSDTDGKIYRLVVPFTK